MLKDYEVVVIGDREFRSVELAYWLKKKKVYFALRQKQDTYIRQTGRSEKLLSELGLAPGMKRFYTGVTYTKKKGFGQFSVAAYWQRNYRGKASTVQRVYYANFPEINTYYSRRTCHPCQQKRGRARCTSPSLPLSSDYHYRERLLDSLFSINLSIS